jgi:hypothetical protein
MTLPPLSKELESTLDEVLVGLEDAAVAGVGIDDELAVQETSVEIDGCSWWAPSCRSHRS